MGRAVRVRPRRHHGGYQRLDRVRPPSLPPGHRRIQGPCRNARQAGHYFPRRCEQDRSRSRHDPVRNRVRQVLVQAGARGHPHECRRPARRTDRAGGRAAAYRALAQRSGRDRLQALGARRDRRDRRCSRGLSARARREGAGACRDRDAGLHAFADRAAGHLRPPPPRLCGDGGARPRPLRRCAHAAQRIPARRRPRSPAPRSRSTAR